MSDMITYFYYLILNLKTQKHHLYKSHKQSYDVVVLDNFSK